LNLNVSNKPSISALNTGHSSSESNLQHVSRVEISPFLKAEALTENRRQKTRAGAVLADTSVKVVLEAEVEARATPVKCKNFLCHANLNNKTIYSNT
jgi:hypothetical protein